MGESRNKKTRLDWVDIAKALSILAIIIGHIGPLFNDPNNAAFIPNIDKIFLFMYSFHVPLFFILSGYTSRPGLPTIDTTTKLFVRTFVPYVVTGILTIAFCMMILPDQNIKEWLAALSYGSGLYRHPMLFDFYPFGAVTIGAIWFLPALFIGKTISSLISQIKPWLRLGISIMFFVIGTYAAELFFLPMDIEQGLCASFYITFGMILSQYNLLEKSGINRTFIIISGVLGLVYMYLISNAIIFNSVYTIAVYPNWIFDAFGTTCASITVIAISQFISWYTNPIEKGLTLIGSSTLPIFCFHSIMMSPSLVMNQKVADICASGLEPIWLFIFTTLICIFIPILFAVLARIIPGFRHVYYPGKKSLLKKENRRSGH